MLDTFFELIPLLDNIKYTDIIDKFTKCSDIDVHIYNIISDLAPDVEPHFVTTKVGKPLGQVVEPHVSSKQSVNILKNVEPHFVTTKVDKHKSKINVEYEVFFKDYFKYYHRRMYLVKYDQKILMYEVYIFSKPSTIYVNNPSENRIVEYKNINKKIVIYSNDMRVIAKLS